MNEVGRLLSLKQLTTTPYHPQCNGLVEPFNGTLKTMLKRMCSENPKDWDQYIDALLFAYREAPQESLGYAPFEMLYGRTVNGPLHILRQLWTKEQKRIPIHGPRISTSWTSETSFKRFGISPMMSSAGVKSARSTTLTPEPKTEPSSQETKSWSCCPPVRINS